MIFKEIAEFKSHIAANKISNIMGIDYGEKKIGLSIGYLDQSIALALRVIKNHKTLTISEIAKDIKSYKVGAILIGKPVKSYDETNNKILRFAKYISAHYPSFPISFWEEDFTTQNARAILKNIKSKVTEDDHLASQMMLQRFIDYGLRN